MNAPTPALQMARLALAALTAAERAALLNESTPVEDRILSRSEVARRFNRSARSIDQWHRRGLLRKVKLPGLARATGFLESDIAALLRGDK